VADSSAARARARAASSYRCSAWAIPPSMASAFTDPWVVDDGKYRAAFGDRATPLDEALTATLAWYADRAPASVN